MQYRRSFYKTDEKRGSKRIGSTKNMGTVFVLIGCVILFVGSMILFRKQNQSVDVPVSSTNKTSVSVSEESPSSFLFTEATLFELTKQNSIGKATRSAAENIYQLNVRAILLSIDRESQYYEVWLKRPLPYDYFSVGEMTTDDSGTFVLDWKGTEEKSVNDYWKYSDVVITLQTRGGEAFPETRVVEGKFGK